MYCANPILVNKPLNFLVINNGVFFFHFSSLILYTLIVSVKNGMVKGTSPHYLDSSAFNRSTTTSIGRLKLHFILAVDHEVPKV